MAITGPYRFKLYSNDDETVEMIRKAGLTPPRLIFNDGSVPISGMVDGESATVLTIRPIAPRKRNTPYDAADPDRDAFAAFVADALNKASPQ